MKPLANLILFLITTGAILGMSYIAYQCGAHNGRPITEARARMRIMEREYRKDLLSSGMITEWNAETEMAERRMEWVREATNER